MRYALPLGLFLILLAGPASALPSSKYTPQYDRCMDASGGVTSEMLDCGSAELAIQDKRLNLAYQNLMGRLGADDKVRLRTEQRAWIRKRDVDCDSREGGTMDLLNNSGCVLDKTIERTNQLDHWR